MTGPLKMFLAFTLLSYLVRQPKKTTSHFLSQSVEARHGRQSSPHVEHFSTFWFDSASDPFRFGKIGDKKGGTYDDVESHSQLRPA